MRTAHVGISLLTLGSALAVSASPQTPATGTVAHINSKRISVDSLPGKAWQERLRAAQRREANDLKALQQKLEATREKLALSTDESARAGLVQQEELERAELASATREAQTTMQKLQSQMNAELGAKVRAEIADIVKGTSIQVVLDSETSVVWSVPDLDLTGAVIERLDKKARAGAR
jgi:Skp family chaperone for outer membrane proteins